MCTVSVSAAGGGAQPAGSRREGEAGERLAQPAAAAAAQRRRRRQPSCLPTATGAGTRHPTHQGACKCERPGRRRPGEMSDDLARAGRPAVRRGWSSGRGARSLMLKQLAAAKGLNVCGRAAALHSPLVPPAHTKKTHLFTQLPASDIPTPDVDTVSCQQRRGAAMTSLDAVMKGDIRGLTVVQAARRHPTPADHRPALARCCRGGGGGGGGQAGGGAAGGGGAGAGRALAAAVSGRNAAAAAAEVSHSCQKGQEVPMHTS